MIWLTLLGQVCNSDSFTDKQPVRQLGDLRKDYLMKKDKETHPEVLKPGNQFRESSILSKVAPCARYISLDED